MKKIITCLLATFGLATGCCQQNYENTDPEGFARKCLINTAMAGKFSSDRTIAQYAAEIWKIHA